MQGPEPSGSFVARMIFTNPELISAGEGLYEAVSEELFGVNVPVPDVDQIAVLAPPPKDPAIATEAPLQEFLSGPALAVGGFEQLEHVTTVMVDVSELVHPAVEV